MFSCSLCDYHTTHKHHFKKHIQCKKHIHNEKNMNILLSKIIQDNQELKTMIKEQNEKIMEFSSTQKKKKEFHLKTFLNETCKDALNLYNFTENIRVSMDDLEYIGDNGYVNGITKIIVDNLKNLDLCERPIHCTDIKREIIHVKDKNKWEIDNENHDKIKKLIKIIAEKNTKLGFEFFECFILYVIS